MPIKPGGKHVLRAQMGAQKRREEKRRCDQAQWAMLQVTASDCDPPQKKGGNESGCDTVISVAPSLPCTNVGSSHMIPGREKTLPHTVQLP